MRKLLKLISHPILEDLTTFNINCELLRNLISYNASPTYSFYELHQNHSNRKQLKWRFGHFCNIKLQAKKQRK